jgi:hypothetical protein
LGRRDSGVEKAKMVKWKRSKGRGRRGEEGGVEEGKRAR